MLGTIIFFLIFKAKFLKFNKADIFFIHLHDVAQITSLISTEFLVLLVNKVELSAFCLLLFFRLRMIENLCTVYRAWQ